MTIIQLKDPQMLRHVSVGINQFIRAYKASSIDLLSSTQAADYLDIPYRTFIDLRTKWRGPKYYKLGTRFKYTKKDLDAWRVKSYRLHEKSARNKEVKHAKAR